MVSYWKQGNANEPDGVQTMMKSSFILETQELGRRLENRWIWKNLNLKVEAGSRIVLKGPTGSGKTLLLRVLAGLENPDHGKVFFQDRDQNQWKMPEYRTQVALLPQRPAFQEGSVDQNWRMPFDFRERSNQHFDSSRFKPWLEMLELPTDFARKQTAELSGGERQLAALLRMLQFDPHLLLLDEPASALDESKSKKMEELLNDWQKQVSGRTWIWVSHDSRQAERVGDEVLELGAVS